MKILRLLKPNKEYENLFALCRPLMQIVNKETVVDFGILMLSFTYRG